MKLIAVAMLSVLTIPAYAQGILGSLVKYQKEIAPQASANSSGPETVVSTPVGETTTSGECLEKDQTSLPLSYVTALILEKNGQLNLSHNSELGELTVTTPDMISNCSTMIQFVPKARTVKGVKSYGIEAKIKQGDSCGDDGCSYTVKKIDKPGETPTFEDMKFKPTMKGFEACLAATGVIDKDGKVDDKKIVKRPYKTELNGFKESGSVYFVSHGPSAPMVGAKYDGKFIELDGCDSYEKITPAGFYAKSEEEEKSDLFEAEKAKMKECKSYAQISLFQSENDTKFTADLDDIRDKLIKDEAVKATERIESGEYTSEDLKTLGDFEKILVVPKIKEMYTLIELAKGQEGSEKAATLEKIKAIKAELLSYNKSPLSGKVFAKLESDGNFVGSSQINGSRLLIESHTLVTVSADKKTKGFGKKEAIARIAEKKALYEKGLADKEEAYNLRTGQTTGLAKTKDAEVKRLHAIKEKNIQGYLQQIAEQQAKKAKCGSSPVAFITAKNCMERADAEIASLQAQADEETINFAKKAAETGVKAAEYAKLEKEGREYVAKQNGETDTSKVEETATYNADVAIAQERALIQQQLMNPYSQQQQPMSNPYAQQQQGYNPYSQQSFNPYAQVQNQNMFMQQNPYAQTQQQSFNPYAQYGINANMGMNTYGTQQQIYNPYGQAQQPYQFNYTGMPQVQQPPQQYQPFGGYQQQGFTANPGAQVNGQFYMFGR